MTKKTTIAELKTFIDAVEFASDSDAWVPSERQWNRIRDMINSLEESVPAVVQQAPAQRPFPQYHPMANIPMGMDTPGMPAGPSPLAGGTMMPSAPQMMNPRAPIANGNAQLPVRTPDIDTSNGQGYTSSFA